MLDLAIGGDYGEKERLREGIGEEGGGKQNPKTERVLGRKRERDGGRRVGLEAYIGGERKSVNLECESPVKAHKWV